MSKKLTFEERTQVTRALRQVLESMERYDDEPEDSEMAYTDAGNFIYNLSAKDLEVLRKAVDKL
jgi:hypothetical protein